MSFDALLISCTGCDFKATDAFPPTQVIYRLESGAEIDGRYSGGWCYCCNDYRYVENIDPEVVSHDLNSAEKDLADAYVRSVELSQGFSELSKKWFARLRYGEQRRKLLYGAAVLPNDLKRTNERIINLRMLLDIASRRHARPRCLRCWSQDTAPVTFEAGFSSDFVHSCGGKFKMGDRYEAGFRVNYGKHIRYYILNTEGELVESPFVKKRDLSPSEAPHTGVLPQ